MKNVKRVATASKKIGPNNDSTWLPLFYSPKDKAVYVTEADDRFLLTYLIRPNTPEEIEKTAYYFLSL